MLQSERERLAHPCLVDVLQDNLKYIYEIINAMFA